MSQTPTSNAATNAAPSNQQQQQQPTATTTIPPYRHTMNSTPMAMTNNPPPPMALAPAPVPMYMAAPGMVQYAPAPTLLVVPQPPPSNQLYTDAGSPAPDPCNLIINYIPTPVTDDDLRGLFASFGDLISARVILDKNTRAPKGYGFVKFRNPEDARKAMQTMNGYMIHNKRLKITAAMGHQSEIIERASRQWVQPQLQVLQPVTIQPQPVQYVAQAPSGVNGKSPQYFMANPQFYAAPQQYVFTAPPTPQPLSQREFQDMYNPAANANNGNNNNNGSTAGGTNPSGSSNNNNATNNSGTPSASSTKSYQTQFVPHVIMPFEMPTVPMPGGLMPSSASSADLNSFAPNSMGSQPPSSFIPSPPPLQPQPLHTQAASGGNNNNGSGTAAGGTYPMDAFNNTNNNNAAASMWAVDYSTPSSTMVSFEKYPTQGSMTE